MFRDFHIGLTFVILLSFLLWTVFLSVFSYVLMKKIDPTPVENENVIIEDSDGRKTALV